MTLYISREQARRYVLGRQGLWPGRRWVGKAGTAEALRYIESVQIDPLNVVARNHDLTLWSRVVDYQPGHLDNLLYEDRAFFDYGGTVMIYPMSELPYWRVIMRRRSEKGFWTNFASQHSALLDEVRQELRARGPLSNRDFTGRARVNSYRARKDTGLALYYLWLTGELMTHHRRSFERVFDFREHVAPQSLAYEATVAEAERFLARKAIAELGLSSARSWATDFASLIQRQVSRTEASRWLNDLIATGEVAAVTVEGNKELFYLPTADMPLLISLQADQVPEAWKSLGSTTQDEVTFLAPLDIVSARGRARTLFDFDYIWEVYKPAATRRWGYYTLPILYGDQLAARLDPKLDRKAQTLVINGFWLEDEAMGEDLAFAKALAGGLAHFVHFVNARRLDLSVLQPASLRERVEACLLYKFTTAI